MIWICAIAAAAALALVLLSSWLSARWAYQLGFADACSKRVRLTDDKPLAELPPELFAPEEVRRRSAVLAKRARQKGTIPWNYRRPGMTPEQKEALAYQLDTGKLDAAIDQVVEEELRKP